MLMSIATEKSAVQLFYGIGPRILRRNHIGLAAAGCSVYNPNTPNL